MKKSLCVLVGLLVAAALLAACGGSGSASSQGGTTATGQTGAVATSGAGTTGGAASGVTNTGQTSTTATTGGAAPSSAAGDAQAGEALFNSATIGSNPGCKTCHTVDGSKLVGPSLKGIASAAATMVPGQSAEQYIRTSILDPNAYVVKGFPEGVMPSFKTVLSDTQLNDIVAYLMTLK